MALNLGPAAYDAVQKLKHNPDWRVFVEALETQMSSTMNSMVEVPVDHRIDASGYARALRDLVGAILQMELQKPGAMPKPTIRHQPPAAERAGQHVR